MSHSLPIVNLGFPLKEAKSGMVFSGSIIPCISRKKMGPGFRLARAAGRGRGHYRQWGMDVGFHDFFRSSPLRTFRPEEADYFLVPSYACCHQADRRGLGLGQVGGGGGHGAGRAPFFFGSLHFLGLFCERAAFCFGPGELGL